MGVDYEERVDFARLRDYRIKRATEALRATECGAFLLFDFYNIRYTTQTWIGGALGDKMIRYALLFRDRDPILWDFGSAVRHHQLYSTWLPEENWRPGFLGFRGAVAPEAGLMRDAVTEIKSLLAEAGVLDAPLGVDIVEPPFLFELQRQGISVADAQQPMLDARVIKSADEIMLLNQAAAMVDGVYQDIVDVLKPGGARTRSWRWRTSGSTSSARTRSRRSTRSPASGATRTRTTSPTASSAPATRRSSTSSTPSTATGPATTAPSASGRRRPRSVDAYKQAREWMDGALDAIKPGVSSDVVALTLPRAQDFGFDSELAAFGLQFAHGLGLGLHERPIISRLNSLEHPVELRPGMVFAMETYCPAADGISAARIEEEVVVTDYGTEILTKFPAQDLFVANKYLTGPPRPHPATALATARRPRPAGRRAPPPLRARGGAG